MVNKGNHPQMALIQVSEILQFTQIINPIKGGMFFFFFVGAEAMVSSSSVPGIDVRLVHL